jgi:hypothetical protein
MRLLRCARNDGIYVCYGLGGGRVSALPEPDPLPSSNQLTFIVIASAARQSF